MATVKTKIIPFTHIMILLTSGLNPLRNAELSVSSMTPVLVGLCCPRTINIAGYGENVMSRLR